MCERQLKRALGIAGRRFTVQSCHAAFELRDVAEELYEEVGSIAMTLIAAKTKRVREKL